MAEVRRGRQTPTKSVVLPYTDTHGQEAIDLYNSTGRTAQEWQELLMYDILAVNEDGLWLHTKDRPVRRGEAIADKLVYALLAALLTFVLSKLGIT